MEIRANYILVGVFALLVVLASGAFLLWVGGKGKNIPMTQYDISFNESVRGLSVNNDVLFTGIRVGKVTDITISRVTPGEVRVRISIASDTPVRQDSVAQLEWRGITGISVISISGGSAQSPLMQVPKGAIGNIRHAPSPLFSAVAHVPDLLAAANNVLGRVEKIFSDENARALVRILASLSEVSDTLAGRTESINNLLLEAERSGAAMHALLAAANEVLANDVKKTSRTMNAIAGRVDSTLAAMEPGLKQFSTQGLADIRLLTAEMRTLIHVLTRVGQKLENDPRRFLFGDTIREYQSQ